ncbi:MAG: M48 family metalloprotease [Candidatus Marsarchaeota archaeon]|nr:M48 family metalloprotease [Candidatus Marsarchaeota archaeon]
MAEIEANMLVTILISLLIGLAIIYAIMLYFGFSFYEIMIAAIIIFSFQWYISPKLIEFSTKIRYIRKDEYPQLQEMIEELAKEFKIPKPRIAIAPVREPNAFVFGNTISRATLVVHEGLLSVLDWAELKAVVAHELSHIRYRDFEVMTMTSFVPILFYVIAQDILWSNFFDDSKNNRSYMVLFGILAFVIHFISELIILPLSFSREASADIYSVSVTKKPNDLAKALYKITYINFKTQNGSKAATSARAFYVVDYFNVDRDIVELKNHYEEVKALVPDMDIKSVVKVPARSRNGTIGMLNSLFSTHPQTYKRIIWISKGMQPRQK